MILNQKKLQQAMANACMSAADVSKNAGIHRTTFYKAGTGKDILPVTAGKIARALGVDVLDILDDQEGGA